MLLKIKEVIKQSGYIEVNYEMTLDYTAAQQLALGVATVTQSGVAGYINGTGATAIKADLVNKLNAAQTAVTNDTKYQYYGMTYNGSVWS
jgi:hypothetical protein